MNALNLVDARVGTFLAEMGVEASYREGGVSVVMSEAALVLVSTFAADGDVWVRMSAVVLYDFEPSLELLHRVLYLNHKVRLGAYQLFEDRTLAFSATLPGLGLDHDLFSTTLRYVARVADLASGELQPIAGGQPGVEAVRSEATC